ncbi:MAG TPA: TlpA disulfide reductase family protein [Bryobacteraceae bacterium]|jgi:thiol-disulfide isomerase/thioredoxin
MARTILITFILAAAAARADLVLDVRQALAYNQMPLAQRMIDSYKTQRGTTPEMIEALSWMARGAETQKNYADADRYAQEVMRLAQVQIAKQTGRVDAEPHLPIAIGAAIEVEAQSMVAHGARDQAITYLREQLKLYYATSIRVRIQKNINLLSLEGKPLPPLDVGPYLGSKVPPTLASLRGKPVFLFFWAHWCSDCKAEEPILAKLKNEYAPKGIVFIAPTQHYGYAAGGDEVPRPVETKYIEAVHNRFYAGLMDVPVPLSEENFKRYGSSTTPTIVLADRAGIVRLYHPGAMTEAELRAQFDAILKR